MKKLQRKGTIVAVSLVGFLTLVGGTIAYNMNSGTLANIFNLGVWRNETTDLFPFEDLTPCAEIPKTVEAKNTGTVPAAVRMKYEEYWKAAGSTSTDHTTELPLVNGDSVRVATVLQQHTGDWELKSDGWYYYKHALEAGQTADSLLRGVSMDCSLNYGGENTCTTANGVTTCTRPDNEYEGATFHVYVTVQYIQADKSTEEWGYTTNEEGTIYDYMATHTNGLDTNVNFNVSASKSVPNGNGIMTLAAHKDDQYPVYYYRGEVDNTLIFGDSCWNIMRTAEHGAVKIVYSGQKNQDNTCPDNHNGSVVGMNNGQYIKYSPFSDYQSMPSTYDYLYNENFGYMQMKMDSMQAYMSYYGYPSSPVSSSSFPQGGAVATKVTYDGQRYHLVDPIPVGESPTGPLWHYYCGKLSYLDPETGYSISSSYDDATATSCKNVLWGVPSGYDSYYIIRLANGRTMDTFIEDLHDNTSNSILKSTLDTWYEQNILSKPGDLAQKVADVVYCNDRTSTYGRITKSTTKNSNQVFDSYVRVTGMDNIVNGTATPHPSVDCTDKADRFTVASPIGNNKLKYPIATYTADEVELAGLPFRGGYMAIGSGSWSQPSPSYDYENVYIYAGSSFWTMSPLEMHYSYSYMLYVSSNNLNGTGPTGTLRARPVIALKRTTRIKSGSGTLSDPFIVE